MVISQLQQETGRERVAKSLRFHQGAIHSRNCRWKENDSIRGYSYTLDDGKYNAKIGGGKIIQITTGADGKVSSVALIQ